MYAKALNLHPAAFILGLVGIYMAAKSFGIIFDFQNSFVFFYIFMSISMEW
jgi:hypothetical protein